MSSGHRQGERERYRVSVRNVGRVMLYRVTAREMQEVRRKETSDTG
jgi:hypothetical protein